MTGDVSVAIAISGPEAGSDSQNMNTRVGEDDGNLYLMGEDPGEQRPESDAAIIWAKFPGLGTVILEFDAPGVEIQQYYTNMNGGAPIHSYMEDVHILDENVLVRGEEALYEQLKTLTGDGVGALCWRTRHRCVRSRRRSNTHRAGFSSVSRS